MKQESWQAKRNAPTVHTPHSKFNTPHYSQITCKHKTATLTSKGKQHTTAHTPRSKRFTSHSTSPCIFYLHLLCSFPHMDTPLAIHSKLQFTLWRSCGNSDSIHGGPSTQAPKHKTGSSSFTWSKNPNSFAGKWPTHLVKPHQIENSHNYFRLSLLGAPIPLQVQKYVTTPHGTTRLNIALATQNKPCAWLPRWGACCELWTRYL